MAKVILEIDSCSKCPFFKEGPMESTDGWDRGCDWLCTKTGKDKVIAGFVEWHEKPKVPDWCPIRVVE